MSEWVLIHWSQLIGALTALAGVLAGLWRLRLGAWLRNRITAELDLIECRRQSEHREAYLTDLLAEIESYKHLRGGSE